MSIPRSLSEFLPALTKDILGKKGLLFAKMLANWSDIAGGDIAAETMPLELKFAKKTDQKSQATLHLAVRSGYALEFSYQKPLLIERLNIFFGYAAIKDIKIIQQDNIRHNIKKPPPKTRPLTLQESRELDEMVAGIQENDLQTALKNLGKAINSRKKNKD